jgi:hypothetical protein
MSFISTLAQRYAAGFDRLRRAIAQWGADHRAPTPLFNFIYAFLGRSIQRLDRLATRWQAGENLRPRATKPRTRKPADAKAPALRLPTGNMWLVKLVQPEPWHVNQGGVVIANLLADPDTKALVEAAPQAGRLLRPLARMFGTELPEWLRLPKRVRKPRVRKPRGRKAATEFRHLSRRRIKEMTAAELSAHFGRLPPHFNLPIPHYSLIRRKIRAG